MAQVTAGMTRVAQPQIVTALWSSPSTSFSGGTITYLFTYSNMWLSERARKSSVQMTSSTPSVRTWTGFSHSSFKRSTYSWDSSLSALPDTANAASISSGKRVSSRLTEVWTTWIYSSLFDMQQAKLVASQFVGMFPEHLGSLFNFFFISAFCSFNQF